MHSLRGVYSAIANGGWPTQAMAALTGKATWSLDPTAGGGITLAQMMSYANNNDLITFDTMPTPDFLPFGLIENHAYALRVPVNREHRFRLIVNIQSS
jgi:hypothetical protein